MTTQPTPDETPLHTYTLSVIWQVCGKVQAQGTSLKDAFERYCASDKGLPTEIDYIEDSLQLDPEGSSGQRYLVGQDTHQWFSDQESIVRWTYDRHTRKVVQVQIYQNGKFVAAHAQAFVHVADSIENGNNAEELALKEFDCLADIDALADDEII